MTEVLEILFFCETSKYGPICHPTTPPPLDVFPSHEQMHFV